LREYRIVMKKQWGIIFLGAMLFGGCAKIGTPTGGPRDVTPPRFLRSSPPNYSTNFSARKIECWFDEYLQLKDINQQLMISPPMKKKPSVTPKGKSFVLELNDTLKARTTYVMDFGNAITDNNEGNVLEGFRYVFSTGDYIDSLSVSGTVISAFDLKPPKESFLILVYNDLSDTAPSAKLPLYVGRTNASGKYRIDNMAEGQYRFYAIKDNNSNFRYDPFTEPVAFIDSVITLSPHQINTDSSGKLVPVELPPFYFFTENDTRQYIKNTNRKEPCKLEVVMNIPPKGEILYHAPSFDVHEKLIAERNHSGDSLTLWITDSLLCAADSLTLIFSYFSPADSSRKTDTVRFNYFDAGGKKQKEFLQLKTSPSRGGTVDLFAPLAITAGKPVCKTDTSKIILTETLDSVSRPRPFRFYRDSLNPRLCYVACSWQPEGSYVLNMYPGFLTTCQGYTNDSLEVSFLAQKQEFYGNIILHVGGHLTSPVIIQLYEKNLVDERYISSDTTLVFSMLKPASYSFKAIYDDNHNKLWDTGNLKKKQQPEEIELMEESLTVRSNWDIEKTWILKKRITGSKKNN